MAERDLKGRFLPGHSFRHTEETKQRIRLASLARDSIALLHTPEIRARAAKARRAKVHPAWNKGRSWSIEEREKLSAAAKRRGMAYLHTPENRAKAAATMRTTFKLKWATDTPYREKLLAHLKELNSNNRDNAAKGGKANWDKHPEEQRRHLATIRQLQNTEELRQAGLKGLRAAKQSPNFAEKRLACILDQGFPGEWSYVGDGTVSIGTLAPDFVSCTGEKAVIELFGERWHKETEIPQRAARFREYGYAMLVIWAKELTSPTMVTERVRKFILENSV